MHRDNGIGQFVGIIQSKVRDTLIDCIQIEYANNVFFYMPVDKMKTYIDIDQWVLHQNWTNLALRLGRSDLESSPQCWSHGRRIDQTDGVSSQSSWSSLH